jgi:hypothetical protein
MYGSMTSIQSCYVFVRRQSRKGTSHYVYKLGEQKIVVVWRRPFVHVDAVKDVLNAIKILHSE